MCLFTRSHAHVIRAKRTGANQASEVRADPQTALLRMGVDDAGLLNMAKGLAKTRRPSLTS